MSKNNVKMRKCEVHRDLTWEASSRARFCPTCQLSFLSDQESPSSSSNLLTLFPPPKTNPNPRESLLLSNLEYPLYPNHHTKSTQHCPLLRVSYSPLPCRNCAPLSSLPPKNRAPIRCGKSPLQKAKNDHLKEKRTAMMSTRPPPNQRCPKEL